MSCEKMALCRERIVDGKVVKPAPESVTCGTWQVRRCCGSPSHLGPKPEQVAILAAIGLVLSIAGWWVFHRPRRTGQISWKHEGRD